MPKSPSMIAGITIAGALALPQLASAAEWWLVAIAKDSSHFSDRSSIANVQVNGKSVVRIWTAFYNSRAENGIKSSKRQSYYDCSERSAAGKSYINYGPDGSVSGSHTLSDYALSWSPIAPGTIGEANLAFACNTQIVSTDQRFYSAEGETFMKVDDLESAAQEYTPKPTPARATAPPAAPARKTVPKR